ncbi:hypothetical protein GUITHDRAFT_137295 [Guillardia theta CCMP2712]|uniref:PDZ domain-containing protein n=1 Tax=Guillardia theta (strain CCMP2712) TaxID=905079 RepID=L1JG55_GUITC|nr:hypothetical protein GUITHDRAFT_137295 [Guillardia theta CCMP2712]EKX47503.1 hypothetical protein GUITHDRAFT_137295 [Guillardia theta CCMP2712]|eukprot:XP_005834483.1 hypothetical protein GUITHDRAFT_137295 [Guillardia theta CCMP2712]
MAGGVGVQLAPGEGGASLCIAGVKHGSPAHAAGAEEGDTILSVNGRAVAKLLAGPVGTSVRVEELGPRSGDMGSGLQKPVAPRHSNVTKKVDNAAHGKVKVENSSRLEERIEQCKHAMTGCQELPKERRKQKRMASLFKFLQEWAIELGAGDVKSIPAEQGGGTSGVMFRWQGSNDRCMLAYLNVDCCIGEETADEGELRKEKVEQVEDDQQESSARSSTESEEFVMLQGVSDGLISTCLFLHAIELYKRTCTCLPISVQAIVDGEFASGSSWLANPQLKLWCEDGQPHHEALSQLRTRGGNRQRKKKHGDGGDEGQVLISDSPSFITMFSALPWLFDDQPTVWLGAGGSFAADVEMSSRGKDATRGGEVYLPTSIAAGIVDEPIARLPVLLLSVLERDGQLLKSLQGEREAIAAARLSAENVKVMMMCLKRHACQSCKDEGGDRQKGEVEWEELSEEQVRRRLTAAWFSCDFVTEKVVVGGCKEEKGRGSLRLPLGYATSRQEEEESSLLWQHHFQHGMASFGVPPQTATHAHARITATLPAGWDADGVLGSLRAKLEEEENVRVHGAKQLLPAVESRQDSINVKAMHMSLLRTFGKAPLLAYSRSGVPAASRIKQQTKAPLYFFSPLPSSSSSRLMLAHYLDGLRCSMCYMDAIFHLVK